MTKNYRFDGDGFENLYSSQMILVEKNNATMKHIRTKEFL